MPKPKDAEERAIRFDASDCYFRLTTEGIRLFSNSQCRYAALGDVIDARVNLLEAIAARHCKSDLESHLRLISAKGTVPIEVTVMGETVVSLEKAIPLLSHRFGAKVSLAEAISLLLFDLIVERQATEIVEKLGLSASDADQYAAISRRPGA